MSKILMLKGLPASGKSTYAKELVARGGWKRVNKDDLRAMLDNSKWSKANEKFVLTMRDNIIYNALAQQQSVVVDDTNFNPVHEQALRDISDELKIPFEVEFIDTPLEECLERNIHRPSPVREHVITDMYNQYLKPKPEVYTPPNAPKAILVDIDGTLAHGINVTRKPYEWLKVGTDTVDPVIKDMIWMASDQYKVVLLSGRDSICRQETIKWLRENNITYDELFMRPVDDSRKDSIVKRELFEENIRDRYNVVYVLDDRNQVVEMWRSMGLKVLQVADGNF